MLPRFYEITLSRSRPYCDGFGPMMMVPSEPWSSDDGLRAPGAGCGAADTQQASRSTSGMVSGQADCEATGLGAGWAHAASKARVIRSTVRIIGERTPQLQSQSSRR
jgi:hypothetical protein